MPLSLAPEGPRGGRLALPRADLRVPPQYSLDGEGRPGTGGEYQVQVSMWAAPPPRGPPGRAGRPSTGAPPARLTPPSPQEGFGWTNGVALQLLDLFGDRLEAPASAAAPRAAPRLVAAALLVLAAARG